MKHQYTFQFGDDVKTVVITLDSDGLRATIDDRTYRITPPVIRAGVLCYTLDDRPVRFTVAMRDNHRYIHYKGRVWILEAPGSSSTRRGETDGQDAADTGVLTASMPGLVVEVLVEAGERVERGQTLVLMEAMKMELPITAPFDGTVRHIHCIHGETVNRDEVLVEMDASE